MSKLEVADLVQFTSLPLEIIGLALTIVEVFYQHKHEKFQNSFTRFLERSAAVQYKYNKIYFWVIFLGLGSSFLIMGYAPQDLLLTVIATYICFGFIVYGFGQIAYRVLCALLPGRNLLAFGITLSIVGVIGELYQVASLINKFIA